MTWHKKRKTAIAKNNDVRSIEGRGYDEDTRGINLLIVIDIILCPVFLYSKTNSKKTKRERERES